MDEFGVARLRKTVTRARRVAPQPDPLGPGPAGGAAWPWWPALARGAAGRRRPAWPHPPAHLGRWWRWARLAAVGGWRRGRRALRSDARPMASRALPERAAVSSGSTLALVFLAAAVLPFVGRRRPLPAPLRLLRGCRCRLAASRRLLGLAAGPAVGAAVGGGGFAPVVDAHAVERAPDEDHREQPGRPPARTSAGACGPGRPPARPPAGRTGW